MTQELELLDKKELATQSKRGLVISDLHLFSSRSDGFNLMDEIWNDLRKLDVLVLNGDVPLIKAETLKKLINFHDSKNADVSLITTKKNNPHGYGRVFTKENLIEKIVEEKDCDNKHRQNLLINSGIPVNPYAYASKTQSPSRTLVRVTSPHHQQAQYEASAYMAYCTKVKRLLACV